MLKVDDDKWSIPISGYRIIFDMSLAVGFSLSLDAIVGLKE